jgi:C-terminal processing protease CtpA/Prc
MGPDDDADDLPPRPPPPRAQRPWRHPSELEARSQASKRPKLWIVVTASALVGTVMAVVMVGLVREFGSSGADSEAATDAALAPVPSREGNDGSDTANSGTVGTLGTLGSTLAQSTPGATPWLGIEGTDVDGGVLVTGVAAEGPAATAGVRPGDLIVAAEREPVATMADLRAIMANFEPGSIFVLDVLRTHYRVRLMAVLGVRS